MKPRRKILLMAAALAISLPAFAQTTPYYVAGDFNGWNAVGNVMTEVSPGIWQATITGLTGRHEFKITEGDWNWNYPGPNSWLYAPASGNVTITYDVNTYSDGWLNTSQRIGEDADPGTWTAVGDWQGWNNANPSTAMTAIGGGVYEYQQMLAPGSYLYKAVVTGTWDSISSDNRNVNTANYAFTVTADDPMVDFFVNALDGTIQVSMTSVPEPASLALFAISSVAMLIAARRRN